MSPSEGLINASGGWGSEAKVGGKMTANLTLYTLSYIPAIQKPEGFTNHPLSQLISSQAKVLKKGMGQLCGES